MEATSSHRRCTTVYIRAVVSIIVSFWKPELRGSELASKQARRWDLATGRDLVYPLQQAFLPWYFSVFVSLGLLKKSFWISLSVVNEYIYLTSDQNISGHKSWPQVRVWRVPVSGSGDCVS